MIETDGFYSIILFPSRAGDVYAGTMSHERDRVISVSLSEAEWRALIARHPQPVQWLREQISDEIGEARDRRTPNGDLPKAS